MESGIMDGNSSGEVGAGALNSQEKNGKKRNREKDDLISHQRKEGSN